ncbi:ATP-dependent DNA helicase DinG [Marinomonas mediterranea]|jgi:Rad3-related DNA helicases|uniref:ATP-dependent DNA helicase DinG n=1 Tax=Marinomonas mediterranea (strain ATCC 700492 / JCM 21426 / NBRC 103028 / MMB-1) TaxID=717774 RepID=F2JTH6_MARM1|nr:ATP-dependent DNA helicase DinG [Marinomonas mediterranea]ADZ91490.1 helicase c2 [Marinomonas mediterranea MMB-1]WCN09457.1 ATP-dependent DNA helicase DinG [Marinomonas mediterranea]WCN17599.1 ATP-dependent DNA helicase DinG [Marinomonas mediterranea MMB-1]
MLSDKIKNEIQSAYRASLESKGHKPRVGQRQMIATIARTLGGIKQGTEGERLGEKHVAVVEAGTGTGKTLSYCLSAIPIAKAKGVKLVISTATVALQEQILFKELPDLLEHTEVAFRYTLAKGRGRYLCLNKLEDFMGSEELATDDMFAGLLEQHLQTDDVNTALYQKMDEALKNSDWDGDKDNWEGILRDQDWRRLTTDHQQCTNRNCANFSACPFFKARAEIETADVIVANHDLVLADLSLGGGAILTPPDETIYVFDEGHHLPDKAIGHFRHEIRLQGSISWLRQLEKNLLTLKQELTQEVSLTGQLLMKIPQQIQTVVNFIQYVQQGLAPYIQQLGLDLENNQHRFEFGVVPEELRQLAYSLSTSYQKLFGQIESIQDECKKVKQNEGMGVTQETAENWQPILGVILGRLEQAVELWRLYSHQDDLNYPPNARWLEVVGQGLEQDIELGASPILAAHTLRMQLWDKCFGAVVTSATLTALNQFNRFNMRSGVPRESEYLRVLSPFDFANKAELIVPDFVSEPNKADDHTKEIVQYLNKHIDLTQGSLVLFSSRKQMESVADQVNDSLKAILLIQGEQSKRIILDSHKERLDKDKGSLLFGLASFAEGVDLPGKYLTRVFIAKIPFSVPDDPVEATLAEWIQKRGGNPFMEISIPDASLKLVQATGRLLRSESDEGEIHIMDKRLKTKRYGSQLIASLPPYKMR